MIVSDAPRARLSPDVVGGADVPFWSAPIDALLSRLGSSPQGLTTEEADRRRRQLGTATIRQRTSSSGWRILLRQFGNPLVVLLTIAAVLSYVVGERTDSAV